MTQFLIFYLCVWVYKRDKSFALFYLFCICVLAGARYIDPGNVDPGNELITG